MPSHDAPEVSTVRLQQDRDAAEAARIAAPEGGKPQHRETAGDLRRRVERAPWTGRVLLGESGLNKGCKAWIGRLDIFFH